MIIKHFVLDNNKIITTNKITQEEKEFTEMFLKEAKKSNKRGAPYIKNTIPFENKNLTNWKAIELTKEGTEFIKDIYETPVFYDKQTKTKITKIKGDNLELKIFPKDIDFLYLLKAESDYKKITTGIGFIKNIGFGEKTNELTYILEKEGIDWIKKNYLDDPKEDIETYNHEDILRTTAIQDIFELEPIEVDEAGKLVYGIETAEVKISHINNDKKYLPILANNMWPSLGTYDSKDIRDIHENFIFGTDEVTDMDNIYNKENVN
ncbi:hypothetical protein K9L97_04180 [Candidatus Woesearchaeota archaeon]|nr:hypothetical protein [Candidatus Woesearchaeota archaeon]